VASPSKRTLSFSRARRAARFVLARTRLRPCIGLVLGSGLGALADKLENATRIEYCRIPHFPIPTAAGHSGCLVIGKLGGVPVAAMQGRVHLYEGFAPDELVFPIRVLAQAGIRAMILTNAAGGISPEYRQGCWVLLRDHINLQGSNPLMGSNDERFGARFPDLTQVHWAPYRAFAREEAHRLGIEIFEGVYAALSGPSYETPAEIRYLRTIGADLVGMSTVPEIIAAAQLGMRVLGISCVTNMAAGMQARPITAEEVLETGCHAEEQLAALLRAVMPRIAADLLSAAGALPARGTRQVPAARSRKR
jgi:purine-nucleoside phosphorylase